METTEERNADERMTEEQLEAAMVAWARRRADENGSQLARDLEVGQATISRWNNSGGNDADGEAQGAGDGLLGGARHRFGHGGTGGQRERACE